MKDKLNLTIEEISEKDIAKLTEMMIKLWPDCDYEEEFDHCIEMQKNEDQTAFVAKVDDDYAGFIQLSLRNDYVEGTSSSPVAYIEGIYVEPIHRKLGVAKRLVSMAEDWGRNKNCSEIASDAELDNTSSIEFHTSVGFIEANRVVCFAKKIDV